MFEIDKMLTVSSAHISEETGNRLTKDPDDNNLGLCVYPITYGWIIMAVQSIDLPELAKDSKFPKELYKLLAFAKELGVNVLNIDGDGDTLEFLETFDW